MEYHWVVSLGMSVLSDDREAKRRSGSGRMDLLAGRGAVVRAAWRRRFDGERRGLLRKRLLPHQRASSPQADACAGFSADGLRARYERNDGLLDVLLPGYGAPRDHACVICVAAGDECADG